MNFLALIILSAIIFDFVLHGIADYLNLKMLRLSVPKAFAGVYDPDRYRKSQQYVKANTRFGWVSSTLDVAVILVFWFGKGFLLLDQWVRSFGHGPIVSGLIYMGILLAFKGLFSLPFRVYGTFVIEARFGFNKTTWPTFMTDLVKGVCLAVLLGAPLLAAVLAFFEYAGKSAWWYCWIAVTVFMLGVQWLAPTWILPLFNKFTPLEDGALKNAILSYADRIRFPLQNVSVMDGSKRSARSNAFFTGFGKHRRIVLFDTLIKRHTPAELLAVLAHEMGHYKKKHILQSTALGVLQVGLMLYLLSFFISSPRLFDAFYMSQKSVYAGLIFFSMLFSPASFFIGIFMQIRSRRNELAADRFAAETTHNPQAMITALKKLSVDNLSNLLPHPLYVFLNYSHPPVLQRIKALEGDGEKKYHGSQGDAVSDPNGA